MAAYNEIHGVCTAMIGEETVDINFKWPFKYNLSLNGLRAFNVLLNMPKKF